MFPLSLILHASMQVWYTHLFRDHCVRSFNVLAWQYCSEACHKRHCISSEDCHKRHGISSEACHKRHSISSEACHKRHGISCKKCFTKKGSKITPYPFKMYEHQMVLIHLIGKWSFLFGKLSLIKNFF